jgi:ribosomal protein S18 acetylase RimI-like enzyme
MRILEYRRRHAPLLARLWNASDAGWPMGLVRFRPKTAGEWREWEARTHSLGRFVAFDGPRAVGFVRLLEWFDSPDATYVQWLNVEPAYHGRGIGKALLLKAMERTMDLGFPRVDLHTWPGNDRAMRLYKRVGYMWVPGSHAYLQNYLPLLLSYPPAKPFFVTHAWTETMQRDLERAVDEDKVQGIDAFVYRFRSGRRVLEAAIDRASRGVMAFEDDSVRVEAWIPDGILVEGVPGTIHWSVRNKTRSDVSVTIHAGGSEGLVVEEPAPFVLAPRSVREVSSRVSIRDSFPDTPEDWAAPAVESTIGFGGRAIPLRSGFRPRTALKVSWEDDAPRLAAPGAREIRAVLRNQATRPLRGELRIEGENLQVDPGRVRLALAKGRTRTLRLRVRNDRAGSRAAHVRFRFTSRDIRTVNTLVLPCFAPAGSVAYAHDDDWILASGTWRFVTEGLGAAGALTLADGTKVFESAVVPGPPYWPNEALLHRWMGRIAPDGAELVRTFESHRRPGLIVEQRWRVFGERTLELRAAVENRGPDDLTSGLAISFDKRRDFAAITFPAEHGPVTEAVIEQDWPDIRRDVPLDRLLTEGWIHLADERGGYGIVWPRGVPRDVEMTPWTAPVVFETSKRIEPGGRREADPVLIVLTRDWREVRDAWAASSGGRPAVSSPSVGSVHAAIDPSVVLASPSAEARVVLHNPRRRPERGTLRLESRAGVHATVVPSSVRRLDVDRAFAAKVRLRAARRNAVLPMRLAFDDWKGTWRWDLPVVATDGRGSIRITGPASSRRVDNGLLAFTASATHGAVLISLRSGGHEYLLSSYPKPGSFSWFRPFYGGVHPFIFQEDWPGNLYRERFRCGDARTGTWRGVRLSARASKSSLPAGVRVNVDYATRPGSSLVAALLEVRNGSGERQSFTAGFWSFFRFDGKGRCGVRFDRLRDRDWSHPSGLGWSLADGGFAVFRARRAPRGLAVIAADPARLEVFNLPREGYHGLVQREFDLPPGEAATTIAMFALASPEDAAAYRVLKGLTQASFEATRPR